MTASRIFPKIRLFAENDSTGDLSFPIIDESRIDIYRGIISQFPEKIYVVDLFNKLIEIVRADLLLQLNYDPNNKYIDVPKCLTNLRPTSKKKIHWPYVGTLSTIHKGNKKVTATKYPLPGRYLSKLEFLK